MLDTKWLLTVNGSILQAFLALAAVTTFLSAGTARSVMQLGAIATKTFDESLMSVSFARKAATDFAKIEEAILALQTPHSRTRVSDLVQEIKADAVKLHQDLIIARERSQSPRSKKMIDGALNTIKQFNIDQIADNIANNYNNYDYHHIYEVQKVLSKQLNYVVNYVAGDAFDYKLKSLQVKNYQLRLNMLLGVAGLIFTALILIILARRISRSIASASAFASAIAEGNLASTPPEVTADTLGDLTLAMVRMRENIRASLLREAALASEAKNILAEALAMSPDGIMVLNAAGDIIAANEKMKELERFGQLSGLANGADEAAGTQGVTREFLAQLTAESKWSDEPFLHGGSWLRLSSGETRSGGWIFVFADVTSLKLQEQKLTDSYRWLDLALENMARGLCLYDASGRLAVVNKTFMDIYGFAPAEVRIGEHYDAVEVAMMRKLENCRQALLRDSRPGQKGNLTLTREDVVLQNGVICRVTRKAIDDGKFIEIHEDVTEVKKFEQRLYDMSRHDGLTGLANRVLIAEHIAEAISRAECGEGFSLLCLDLDLFKDVNDTFGHPVGDALLCAVADRIRNCLRPTDVAGRLGGDEFAIILCGLTSAADIQLIVERLVDAISQPYDISGNHANIGVSIGISVAPQDGYDGEKLLQKADAALYLAKTQGRGTWRFYDAVMDNALRERRSLEADLRLAIGRNELEVHYQPIYHVAHKGIGSYEALLRWRHPQRGLVPPSEFIPLAEETGLIYSLGEWVLNTACKEVNSWPCQHRLSVNLSLAQLKPGNFKKILDTCLSESGLAPERLDLEITESIFLEKNAYALNLLQEVRNRGVTISLDDFGTGYSSLSYLGRFPFDRIKIDRSFVQNVLISDQAKVVVEAVLLISKRYNMRVTAEGVESKEQLEWLCQANCNEIQGYFIGRPMTAAEILRDVIPNAPPEAGQNRPVPLDIAI
ncbi:MAG: EAL domain-containing protein [Hyphomicrobiales bacterium]|nr:EAL domain-containing protein [Hyphomicrobiales bacterium]